MSFRLSRDRSWRPVNLASAQYRTFRTQAFVVQPDSAKPLLELYETRHRLCILLGCIEEKKSSVPGHFLQDSRGNSYVHWRMNRLTSRRRLDKPPELSDALREFKSNLNKIVDITSERGVRIVFATQPSIWKANMPAHEDSLLWMGGVGRFQRLRGQPYYNPVVLAQIIGMYNDALVEVCTDRDVEFVDLAAVIPKDTTSFYDDCHFNESGARRVAEAFTDYLVSTPPLAKNRRK
jgi:hypothetical protein